MSGVIQHPHIKSKIAERILAMTALAAAGCLWGTGFLFAKIAFREMGVVANVSLRFLFGSIVLAPMFFRKTRKFRRRHFWLMVLASFVGIPLQFLIQFKGVSLTTRSHASLMVSTLPVLLALTSTIFVRERLRPGEWIILFLSTIGAVLIFVSKTADGPQTSLKGDLMVVLSMIAAVVLTLLTKKLIHNYDPLYVTASMIVAGTLFLLICLAFEHPRSSAHLSTQRALTYRWRITRDLR
jgi:drug/metabolite transporter (DMT)-like permease